MNFQEFYQRTENRLTDAILSLWATGDKEMQDYFKFLLSKDPLMADVVFQNTFPWEQGDIPFGKANTIFKDVFIRALDTIEDEEFRFPKDRMPYKHQLKSWDALLNKGKSIAVTTGTGSGKTECFMLPVLHDIYENARDEEGISAIFLYPLNALIGSQKKRMHAWCSSLKGLRYGLLTGDTDESQSLKVKKRALPELISREQIRETPPQILFTNPTMLEYMLVRNSDTPILEKSKGSLRWILLDEAHTLTGSKAAEIALLIRRVIAAFQVDIKDVRFAITSATVGSGNTDILKNFMANLCGINTDQIEVIEGRRVNNQIAEEDIPHLSETLSKKNIKLLRDAFLQSTGLDQKDLRNKLGVSDKYKQLEIIDTLAEYKVNGENLLPVRGHFFTRGIGGVYVCTNKNCDKHEGKKPDKALGTMYTIAGKNCECGYPLLELIACRSCGNMMLEGERKKSVKGTDKVLQSVTTGYEAFNIDGEEDEDKESSKDFNKNIVRLIRSGKENDSKYGELTATSISMDNDLISGDDFLIANDNKCPHCGNKNDFPIHFRLSSAFTNRILSDIILDQTTPEPTRTKKMLYGGRKYISFTDSRQGTAKIAAYINIDSQSNWIRYQVYHYLLRKLKDNEINASLEDLLKERANCIKELETALPFRRSRIEEDINQINAAIETSGGTDLRSSRSLWKEIIDEVKVKSDFETLYKKGARGNDFIIDNETYAKTLLYDQFARRIPRERSMENLGLINLVYPALDNIVLPKIAERLHLNQEDWTSLLKIAMDYVIRYNYHFVFDKSMYIYTSKIYRSNLIYPPNTDNTDGTKWRLFNPNSITQSKLVLLICAGLGWHDKGEITNEQEDQINDLLTNIWQVLQKEVLTPDKDGFRLDFLKSTQLEIAGKEYLCPVTKRLVDKVFKGYSPLIKGNLDPDNIRNFKIDNRKTYAFPTYDYPYHRNKDNETIEQREVDRWLAENSQGAREKGLWNDFHERIFDYDKFYLAGEHSAQQSQKRLKELEKQFEKGEVNILSCSTTMEMGVDIGGISAVVMSNVPPMPANYLQRTGRAGRRSENKSLALTFCAPNPIGLRTMKRPKWALEHPIAPPTLTFDSKTIITRHVNSYIFGLYIRQDENKWKGLNINENIETLFYKGDPTMAEGFLVWMQKINHSILEKQLKYLTKGTPLAKTPIASLITIVSDNFKKVISNVRNQKEGFEKQLQELADEHGENSPAYKAVNYRRGQFFQKFILSYLAEVGFLPNAGLPIGVVDFEKTTLSDIKKEKPTKFKNNPSYPITRALTEFAPGNNILIDGLNYKSGGIVMKNNWGHSSQRTFIQGCRKCGYQRTVDFNKVNDDCPKCKSPRSFTGVDLGSHRGGYTELVEPAGFSIDLFHTPTRAISERNRPQYLEPLLLNIEPWDEQQNGYVDYRTSAQNDEAQILFYNTGLGEGYSLCLNCGRVETSNEKLEGHKRLRGGKDKNGESLCVKPIVRDNIILGSKLNTDFTEIRLKDASNSFVNNKQLIYSLGVIFTKVLANHLGVEEMELGFGIKKYKSYQTIFIYDTANGGVGYSSQFRIYTKEILKKAFEQLDSCDCMGACTRCLVDRSTQWNIEDLDRFQALKWLKHANTNQLPEELSGDNESISVVIGSLYDEFYRLNYHYSIKEINIHVSNTISEWEIEDLHWLEEFKRDRIIINFIVEGSLGYTNNQERLSVYLLSHNYNIKIGQKQEYKSYPVFASVRLGNGEDIGYISKNNRTPINGEWTEKKAVPFYKVEQFSVQDYSFITMPKLDTGDLYESRVLSIPRNTNSDNLADKMLQEVNNPQELISKVKNKSYTVSYYDRYNQSEFSMRLMLQFVHQLKELLSIEVTALNVHLEKNAFRYNSSYPNFIIDNYKEYEDYTYDLKELAENFTFKVNAIPEHRLAHYRYFEFKSDSGSFTIRIDGGIAHGFKPVKRLTTEDMTYDNEVFSIRKDVPYAVIYNISID